MSKSLSFYFLWRVVVFQDICDYNSHMIKTLRESKATLSALIEQVSQGEEVIITVHGKPKARLCPIETGPSEEEKTAWKARTNENFSKYTLKVTDSSAELIQDLRKERL